MMARESLPVRGAWIEITVQSTPASTTWSLPVRGAWIEISRPATANSRRMSLPVRGAWIEICCYYITVRPGCVAPRAGSVD